FMELANDPDADPDDYAAVIGADVSLSTELLTLANSSWFGIRNEVTSVKNAVILLGLGTVRALAISHCLAGVYSELRLSQDESRAFWQTALCKAVAAKRFANPWDEELNDAAFLAGMLQDLAIPVMYAMAKEQEMSILLDPASDWRTQLRAERAVFRMDHTEVGRLLARKLGLPELFADIVAFHHNYAALAEFIEDGGLRDGVYAASLLPHALNHWNHQDAEELGRFLQEHTQPNPVSTEVFLAVVQREFDRLFQHFESGQAP
ncbi:unnamed protein product, partial [marine sediment metagenome]